MARGSILPTIITIREDPHHESDRLRADFRSTRTEDPNRNGLAETPARYVRDQHFAGYGIDPHLLLQRTFSEIGGYDEMVLLRGIHFESHCEHHLAPIIGRAWVAYLPDKHVVGISKLADAIDRALHPKGVAVVLKATHHCLMTRGVLKPATDLVTSRMLGRFRDDPQLPGAHVNVPVADRDRECLACQGITAHHRSVT